MINAMTKSLNIKLIISFITTIAISLIMLNLGLKNILDARLYYTPEYFVEFFNRLDPEMRHLYTVHESVDFAFIISYGLFLFWGLQKIFGTHSRWCKLVAGPVLFDFIETTAIWLCLQNYLHPSQVSELGFITFLKWASGFALVGAALLRIVVRTLRTARS